MSLNLHGVVRVDHPLSADRCRLVTWRDLAMVVSEPQTGEHSPGQRNAMAHLAMLSRLVLDGPVVPLRFGTTAVDDDTVRTEVLARSATTLREHLDRLDGAVEVHAYLRFDESAALRAVFDENRAGWRTGNVDLATRIRLGERVAHHVVAWRRARSQVLLAPVAAVARAQVSLPECEYTEQRHAFLVPTGELDTARAAIADLTNVPDLDAECVGPLPGYSFLAEPTEPHPKTGHSPTSRWGW
jgi:hypothetical protein